MGGPRPLLQRSTTGFSWSPPSETPRSAPGWEGGGRQVATKWRAKAMSTVKAAK